MRRTKKSGTGEKDLFERFIGKDRKPGWFANLEDFEAKALMRLLAFKLHGKGDILEADGFQQKFEQTGEYALATDGSLTCSFQNQQSKIEGREISRGRRIVKLV